MSYKAYANPSKYTIGQLVDAALASYQHSTGQPAKVLLLNPVTAEGMAIPSGLDLHVMRYVPVGLVYLGQELHDADRL